MGTEQKVNLPLELISFYNPDSFWYSKNEAGDIGTEGVSTFGYPTDLSAKFDSFINHSLLPFPLYAFINSYITRITCDLVIDSDDGTLLTKRSNKSKSWPGLWHNMGGTKLITETCAESALRTAKEEVGLYLTIENINFLENIEFPLRPAEFRDNKIKLLAHDYETSHINEYGTGVYNGELSIFYYTYRPSLKISDLTLDKNTADARFFKFDKSKENGGLPSPMLPQHVYMIAKHSKHFGGLRE